VSRSNLDPKVARFIALFENLTLADVARLPEVYATNVQFKDPFNEVSGVADVQRIFNHMFKTLEQPRFVVRDVLSEGEQCFLSWEMLFRLRRLDGKPQVIRGASHLVFDATGRVVLHRDYWDAAEELYEKLPYLGALMRWLKRRVNSP
jgi:steroid Delta-isomerase